MAQCAPHSLITALGILVCAGVLQALQGYPNTLSVSFLLLGVTSVIHHSRLDSWWKNDAWRMLDYMAVFVFFTVASIRFRDTLTWQLLCVAIVCNQSLIWRGHIEDSKIPVIHASMHLMVCGAVLYLGLPCASKVE